MHELQPTYSAVATNAVAAASSTEVVKVAAAANSAGVVKVAAGTTAH